MKRLSFMLTILAVLALSACNSGEKEAAEAAAVKAAALEKAATEFLTTINSFDYDVSDNIEANAGNNFMMYQLPNKTAVGVEYGEYAFEVQLTKAAVVKKIPGANAFFKGNHAITKWDPIPTGYGIEYHVWPGKVVSADLLITYPDDKLVSGGIYDGWLGVESIADLKAEMEPGKKVALVGTMPLYYVDVYDYKGGTKGALKSRHLLFPNGLR